MPEFSYFSDIEFMKEWMKNFENSPYSQQTVFKEFEQLSGISTEQFSNEMRQDFLRQFFACFYKKI